MDDPNWHFQAREWWQPFTAAIDCYRALLLQIRTLENQKLQLSELDILAENCPKCFGPPAGVTRPEESDVTVCLDGNYQHRRHAAASVIIPGSHPPRPEIFLQASAVNKMARKWAMSTNGDHGEELVHDGLTHYMMFAKLTTNL